MMFSVMFYCTVAAGFWYCHRNPVLAIFWPVWLAMSLAILALAAVLAGLAALFLLGVLVIRGLAFVMELLLINRL